MPALIAFITADESLLRRVSQLLESEGHRVIHGGGGGPAQTFEEPPDVVLVDSTLTGTEVPAVVSRLRAGTGRRPPVLVLADRENAESALAGLRAGAEDALLKPLDPLGLPARIDRLLLRRQVEQRDAEIREHEFRARELESFIYIVTHDMKTPVVNLQGLVGLVEQDHGPSLAPEVRDYLTRLRRNAERLEELLRDLLEYPRKLSVVGPVTPQDMTDVAEEAIDGLRENAQAAGVEVVVDPELPTVPCDPKRVQQVFHNLVENAIKHASDAPNPRVDVGWKRTSNGARFHVRDNGPGIPKDQQDDVFKLFHRPSGTKREGTGIGLAVARHLVEAHGGEIWCESDEGKGTSFFFTLGRV